MIEIKTLADILAHTKQTTDTIKPKQSKQPKQNGHKQDHKPASAPFTQAQSIQNQSTGTTTKRKTPKPTTSPPTHQSSTHKNNHQTKNDEQVVYDLINLQKQQPSDTTLEQLLQPHLKTDEEKQAEITDIKTNARLRWLAFYYLSRKEYSKAELKQKLLEKQQDPKKIDELLAEFAEKGYQSEYRTALMIIRENLRKGRGRNRIRQAFAQKKIEVSAEMDELIEMAIANHAALAEYDDSLNESNQTVDWLRLAVEARVKKYGDTIPTNPKDKNKQLRFLQYRGFQMDICFEALKYDLQKLDER